MSSEGDTSDGKAKATKLIGWVDVNGIVLELIKGALLVRAALHLFDYSVGQSVPCIIQQLNGGRINYPK